LDSGEIFEDASPPLIEGIELTQAGHAIPNGGRYHIPLNIQDPAAAAVAIFSEIKELMMIRNTSEVAIMLSEVSIIGTGDLLGEEMKACSDDSAVNQCRPFEYGALEPGESANFQLHFYPVQSGERTATISIRYEVGGESHSYSANLSGHGRVGSDEYPAYFFSAGSLESHRLWGGYDNNHDEAPGPMVADASGNIYFAGTTSGLTVEAANSDRNIFLVKVNADGSLGWERQYHSTAHDIIVQTGDNLGLGAADALAIAEDGMLYLVGKAGNGNNRSVALIMKVDPATGDAVWLKHWFHNPERLQYTDSAQAVAVDVVGDRVYVVGGVSISCISTEGSLLWSHKITPQGSNAAHRLHSVRSDGAGHLYLGGLDYSSGASGPFVAKLSGVDDSGANLNLDWAKTLDNGDLEMGSNINSMALDAEGNLFIAVDRRGAQTYFSLAKISADGQSFTGKTLPGTAGDRNNIYVVRVVGDFVYAGGRTGQAGWDTGGGDGLIAKLNTADMSLAWGSIYYTGSGPNEVCHHSIHGMAAGESDLYLMGQVYTGNLNFYRYWGYWYDFPHELEDYIPVAVNDVTDTTTHEGIATAAFVDGSFENFNNDAVYDAIDSAAFNVELQNAQDKNENSNGSATDSDVFMMHLTMP